MGFLPKINSLIKLSMVYSNVTTGEKNISRKSYTRNFLLSVQVMIQIVKRVLFNPVINFMLYIDMRVCIQLYNL